MTALDLHVLYAVQVFTDQEEAEAYIDQVTDFNLTPGLLEVVEAADGLVDATYAAAMSANPVISFSTTDLAAALDLAAFDGLHITSTVNSGVTCWLQKVAEGATRAGASSHVRLIVGNGMMVPRTVTAAQNVRAVLGMDILPVSADGSTTPIAIEGGQSLEGSPLVSALWTLGRAKVNNSDLPDVDVTIDFGINVIREAADGHVYPTYAAIMSRTPSITFTTPNVAALVTYGLVGAARSASTVVTLRKMAEGATRTAPDTPEHISFAVAEGRISVQSITGPHGQRLGAAMRITPTYNGTLPSIVIDTTAET